MSDSYARSLYDEIEQALAPDELKEYHRLLDLEDAQGQSLSSLGTSRT